MDKIFAKLSGEFRDKLYFVITDIKGEIEEKLAEYFNLKEKDIPQLRITNVKGDEDIKNYIFADEDITEENVRKFLVSFLAGKLSPTLKSEEIPTEQNEPVYVLVGKNFKEVVMNKDKDVLVEYYAPWCGHCKQLEPIYTKVAEHFRKNPNIIIAKIDATANDLDTIVEGFPTIKFYPADKKSSPVDYEGNRTYEDIVTFVEEQVSKEKSKKNHKAENDDL